MSAPKYAGFWIRLVAFIIDSLLIVAIATPVLLAFFDFADIESGSAATHPVYLLMNYLFPAVAFIVFWIYKSADPGKMIFDMKIVDEKTGGKPSNGQMIGRYFAYYVSTLLLGMGFIWIAFDKRKQGWHDKLAGTLVIRDSVSSSPDFPTDKSA